MYYYYNYNNVILIGKYIRDFFFSKLEVECVNIEILILID